MPGHVVRRTWRHDPTIDAPPRYRRACEYEAFVPDRLAELHFSLDARVAGLVSEAEAEIAALNASARPALAPLARLLLRTESIASSKIEGMQVGVRELARAEAKLETGRTPGPSASAIIANIEAMESAIEAGAALDAFRMAGILEIHRRLMARALNAERIAGVVRTTQNWIGGNDHNPCGADFVPPPPEQVPGLLEDLCAGINDDLLPPVVQAALVHAQFETIHPFADGNGRTGRALIHVVLRRRRVAQSYIPPISVALAGSRERYIQGLTQFRSPGEAGVAQWVEGFANAAYQAARLASSYLLRVEELRAGWKAKLQGSSPGIRADATVWRILEILPGHPMITVPVAAAATHRGKTVVHEAVQSLENAGILLPLSSSRRNRTWEAAGLLDIVAELEAGTSPDGGTRPTAAAGR
jgi:Fic family protein